MHKSNDTQKDRDDDAEDKQLESTESYFGKLERYESLKWTVSYSTKANNNSSSVVECV